MNGPRGDLDAIRERLRRLLHEHSNKFQSLEIMVRRAEQKIKDKFAELESSQSAREELGKRFRKPVPRTVSAIEPIEPDRSRPRRTDLNSQLSNFQRRDDAGLSH